MGPGQVLQPLPHGQAQLYCLSNSALIHPHHSFMSIIVVVSERCSYFHIVLSRPLCKFLECQQSPPSNLPDFESHYVQVLFGLLSARGSPDAQSLVHQAHHPVHWGTPPCKPRHMIAPVLWPACMNNFCAFVGMMSWLLNSARRFFLN